jgi:hypothetical protein
VIKRKRRRKNNMKKLNHKQQLKLIEGLCLVFENGKTTDISRAKEIIGNIYKISHLNGTCKNPHLDWHVEASDLAIELTKNGITEIK